MNEKEAHEAETETAFSNGIHGVYERRRELETRVKAAAEKIADIYDAEEISLGRKEAERLNDERRIKAQEQHWVLPVPLWQQVSGLYPDSHRDMSPNERAGRIRVLLRRVERMIRFEMKREAVNAGASSRQTGMSAPPSW